jgi:hypothetical protein
VRPLRELDETSTIAMPESAMNPKCERPKKGISSRAVIARQLPGAALGDGDKLEVA